MANQICVGLDGSEASIRALDLGMSLAGSSGKLLLVHVIDWSPFVIETFEENEYRGAIRKEQLARAEREVIDPAVARVRKANRAFEAETVFGAPAEELARLANAHSVDMIVVGKTGTSKLERIMFGSKANKLIQVSEVPVAVVP
ncbi:MAG: universal stress protein [Candidatus Competibacterales bacterium]|nr:universal stress protein [Candidatus Competibacterales bacterium]